MYALPCLFLFLALIGAAFSAGTLKTINGELVNVVDDCDPNDPASCGSGKCCVQEHMFHIPEAQGPFASYTLACRPLLKQGSFCYSSGQVSHEMCACASGLTCKTGTSGLTFFGHCN